MLYLAVVQVVLFFVSDSWSVLWKMTRMVEGTLVGFLQDITGNRMRRTKNGMWETPAAGGVLRESGMETLATYIGIRQVMVYHWVALLPIFKLFAR